MACGCGDRCTCTIIAGENVTVTGSGDVSDPFVISSPDTVFAASNSDNTIIITPGGTYGHSPVVNTQLSNDPGNVLEKHGDGLFAGSAGLSTAVRYIGELIDLTGTTIPALTLECDGTEYAVASYPDLAGEYGASGIGDGLWDNHPQFGLPGAGNFRVPDLLLRSTIGKGAGDTIGDTDGIAYASRDNAHTHTGPSHTHNIPNHQHSVSIVTDGNSSNQTGVAAGINPTEESQLEAAGAAQAPGTAVDITIVTVANDGHTHNVNGNTGLDGGGGATTAAGTGATGSTTIPYGVTRKVVFAGA